MIFNYNNNVHVASSYVDVPDSHYDAFRNSSSLECSPPTREAWVRFSAETCQSRDLQFRMKMTLVKSLHILNKFRYLKKFNLCSWHNRLSFMELDLSVFFMGGENWHISSWWFETRIIFFGVRSWQCCGSGIRCLFYPWFRDLDPGPGSGMNNPDHNSKSLETIFWVKILEFFETDPGWKKLGSRIRDVKNSDAGSEIIIPDPQHWFVVSSLKILTRTFATNPL